MRWLHGKINGIGVAVSISTWTETLPRWTQEIDVNATTLCIKIPFPTQHTARSIEEWQSVDCLEYLTHPIHSKEIQWLMQDKGDFIGKFKNFQYQLKLKRCQTDALLDNAFVTRVAHQGKTHLSENTAAMTPLAVMAQLKWAECHLPRLFLTSLIRLETKGNLLVMTTMITSKALCTQKWSVSMLGPFFVLHLCNELLSPPGAVMMNNTILLVELLKLRLWAFAYLELFKITCNRQAFCFPPFLFPGNWTSFFCMRCQNFQRVFS